MNTQNINSLVTLLEAFRSIEKVLDQADLYVAGQGGQELGNHGDHLQKLVKTLMGNICLARNSTKELALAVQQPQTTVLAMSPNNDNNSPVRVVAIGNPGVGKSTFLNCLIQSPNFKSGISYGDGLTTVASAVRHGDLEFIDTPGLADNGIAAAAANEINRVLQQGGNFKLLFFMRLSAGRVVDDDMVTLERVLEIFKTDVTNQFAVVFNNLDKQHYRAMVKRGPEFESVVAVLQAKFKTEYMLLVPHIKALDEEDDKIAELPAEAVPFITNAPVLRLNHSQVGAIDATDYRSQAHELQSQYKAAQLEQHEAQYQLQREQQRVHHQATRLMGVPHRSYQVPTAGAPPGGRGMYPNVNVTSTTTATAYSHSQPSPAQMDPRGGTNTYGRVSVEGQRRSNSRNSFK